MDVPLLYYQDTLKSSYRKYRQMNYEALFLIKPLQIYTATRTLIPDLLANWGAMTDYLCNPSPSS